VVAHAGHDTRVLRPLTQGQIEALWRGVRLEPLEHLATNAAELVYHSLRLGDIAAADAAAT
jgi:hypothetical protein